MNKIQNINPCIHFFGCRISDLRGSLEAHAHGVKKFYLTKILFDIPTKKSLYYNNNVVIIAQGIILLLTEITGNYLIQRNI